LRGARRASAAAKRNKFRAHATAHSPRVAAVNRKKISRSRPYFHVGAGGNGGIA
jgi:hypothetical protein